jgi:hypothetical protein
LHPKHHNKTLKAAKLQIERFGIILSGYRAYKRHRVIEVEKEKLNFK